MKKIISLSTALMLVLTISKAQTAMDFAGLDCNGNYHHLFDDLNAGKAVLIHFYMPNCGACPPPAQKIQAMANNVNDQYPDMVRAYAFPYNNSTTCSYSSTWVFSNGLPLYMPYDSGSAQVAHYGGFGMPTVVLLGGIDHRVMFSTLSFSTSDTTIMRDSIMALYHAMNPSGMNDLSGLVSSFRVFPNPANDNITINLNLKKTSNLLIDVADISGKQVALIMDEKQYGLVTKQFSTAALPNGNYLVRLQVDGKTDTQKLNVIH